MITKIIDSIKDRLIDNFRDKTELSEEQARKAASIADDSLKEGLKNEAVSNPNGLLDILTGRANINSNNPVIENLVAKYISDLIGKAGIPAAMASSAAKFAIPFVMEKLAGKYMSESGKNDMGGMLDFLGIGGLDNLLNKDVTKSGDKLLNNFKKLF